MGPISWSILSLTSISSLVWCDTSLLGQFVSYEENEVLWIRPLVTINTNLLLMIIYKFTKQYNYLQTYSD